MLGGTRRRHHRRHRHRSRAAPPRREGRRVRLRRVRHRRAGDRAAALPARWCASTACRVETLVRALSVGPARILGVPGGSLASGATADVTVIDPGATPGGSSREAFHSKSRNTPFGGLADDAARARGDDRRRARGLARRRADSDRCDEERRRWAMKARLALADGTVFEGTSFGAAGEAGGEVVFNTSMTGYQEILTDPSYCGQLVAMTYPEIGNVGVNREDVESRRPFVDGLHRARSTGASPSNWRARAAPRRLPARARHPRHRRHRHARAGPPSARPRRAERGALDASTLDPARLVAQGAGAPRAWSGATSSAR